MAKVLKLYVWKGMAFAYATNAEQARSLVLRKIRKVKWRSTPKEQLVFESFVKELTEQQPQEVTEAAGFYHCD